MINKIVSDLKTLFSYNIFVGCSVRNVPERSIILFPLQPERLNCGLAGVLAIKGAKNRQNDPQKDFPLLSKKLSPKGWTVQNPGDFLSPDTLGELEGLLFSMKQDIGLQFEINRDGRLGSLRSSPSN